MKLVVSWLCLSIVALAAPTQKCVITESELVAYEHEILRASTLPQDQMLKKISRPMHCILQIQEKSEGFLKYLANSFLRPLLGGPQSNGLPLDKRYQTIAAALVRSENRLTDPLHNSIMTEHARGAWSFYSGFCRPDNQEACIDFLPDEGQIDQQSPLLAASSMMLLRSAYLELSGKPKEDLANRIRKVYEQTKKPSLQRKVIEQIFLELFGAQLDLTSLS